jgi:hypothetical protein
MGRHVTRSDVEAACWRQLGPCGTADAVDAILAAVDAYTAAEAERASALAGARVLAGLYPAEPAEVTARRRAELDPRTATACACGCGEPIAARDAHGRERRFRHGHNSRLRNAA